MFAACVDTLLRIVMPSESYHRPPNIPIFPVWNHHKGADMDVFPSGQVAFRVQHGGNTLFKGSETVNSQLTFQQLVNVQS